MPKIKTLIIIGILILATSTSWAYRVPTPRKLTDLTDQTQVTELNEILKDFWDITNGRYTNTHGEIYVLGNTTETVIAGAGTFVQVTIFANNGNESGTTPDHTTDDITILSGGKYLVVCSIHAESVGAGAADTISVEIRKNNGTTAFSNLHAHRKLAGGGGDIASISISGIADLDVNDTVEVWLTNDDNATDLLVADINLSVVQIDG